MARTLLTIKLKKHQKFKNEIETDFLANLNNEFSYFYKLIILTKWLGQLKYEQIFIPTTLNIFIQIKLLTTLDYLISFFPKAL